MTEEPKIVEREVRNKDGKVLGRITYDGQEFKVEGKNIVLAKYRDSLVGAWAEKYRTTLELIEDTGAKCTMCGGEQALYRHVFMNDPMRRKEMYKVIQCKLCGNSVAVHGSHANVPYE